MDFRRVVATFVISGFPHLRFPLHDSELPLGVYLSNRVLVLFLEFVAKLRPVVGNGDDFRRSNRGVPEHLGRFVYDGSDDLLIRDSPLYRNERVSVRRINGTRLRRIERYKTIECIYGIDREGSTGNVDSIDAFNGFVTLNTAQ